MHRALAAVALAWASTAAAQEPEQDAPPAEAAGQHDESELAAQTQNPVAALISVPLQENLDYGIGPNARARSTLNIQPVIPTHLFGNWNLISRIIIPVVYQPDVMMTTGGSSGLGDLNPQFFVSPAKPGALIWGLGPAFLIPTATQTSLGTGRWGAGPTGVVLVQPKPWTIGVLASNLWSFAGDDGRANINQLTLQYLVNYNLPHGWYLTSAPILTANWKAASGDTWLVPFGGGAGKVFKLGKQAMNGSLSAYGNAVKPTGAPDWQLRAQLALLFPK
jgi:hypothetical protein